MKFVKIHHMKDIYWSLPAEKRAELSAAAYAFADKYAKAGKMTDFYFMADIQGGFAVWDVASHEELLGISAEYPLLPYTEYETYPVVEYSSAAKMFKARAASRKAP